MNLDPRGAIYRSFELFPLKPNDPAYVNCEAVRGEQNVLQELGETIILSGESYTCQLYTGARGSGKSTELLRLQKDLSLKGYFVVYFEADRGDIEVDNTEYVDVLLACTRHIIEDLKDLADPKPILSYLKNSLQSLKELGLTELELEKVGVEFQLPQFGKLMTNFKSVPDLRTEIRKKIDSHTPSLLAILNQFITEAKKKLPESCTQKEIVVIVDNLDRIVPIYQENGKSNYERIFIDRKNLLRGLHCHVIYTIPISMAYSSYTPNLAEDYGKPVVVPMIMTKTKDDQVYTDGINILKKIIKRRLIKANVGITLDNLFVSADALEELCKKSGGYVRNLMQLIQASVKNSPGFPIPDKAVKRAIAELRQVYHNSIYADDWKKLAEVSLSKGISRDSKAREYRELLFRRCVLEYRWLSEDGELEYWHDVHPLIETMSEFISLRETLKKEDENNANSTS